MRTPSPVSVTKDCTRGVAAQGGLGAAARHWEGAAAAVARRSPSESGSACVRFTMESAGSVLSDLVAKTIHVVGLPDEDTVRNFCERFGALLGVTMVQKSSKRKSWAFVTFEAVDDAERAICMGLSAAVPGKEIVVTLESKTSTWDATVLIKGADEVEAKRSRELAAHATRVAVLLSGPAISSSDEDEDEDGKTEQSADGKKGQSADGTRDLNADLDLLIIGAGASGVGCSVMAKKFGIDPARTLIVERGSEVGSTFTKWPAEMRFITPSFNQQAFGMMDLNSVAFDSSPGQMFQEEHPTGKQYAQYLQVVAHMHGISVLLETEVTAITPICLRSGGQRCANDSEGFEVSVTHASGATHTLPEKIRAKFVIWAAGEFQYPRSDGFPGASTNCVHNSTISSWEALSDR